MADKLDPNAADRWASVIRQAGSLAPAAGPVAAELLTQVIPRQRMDRVVEHIRRIDMRLQVIEAGTTGAREVFERNARSEYGTAIIEDSVIQSARTVEPESRERIAALVVRSLTEEELQHERTRKLLNICNELTYPEIIWLLYYSMHPTIGGGGPDGAFYEKHEAILRPVSNRFGNSESEQEHAAIQGSHKNTLERLGLLEDRKPRERKQSYGITSLGSVLVKYIELADYSDE